MRAVTVSTTAIDRDALLGAVPKCEISFTGDASYTAARNKGAQMHPDFPLAVAKPTTAREVAALLTFAKERSLKISIQGGGHSSLSMKGQLVVSMRNMNAILVDTESMTVKIGGGCLAKEVDAACAPHGIACVLGNAYTVGVAGLLMGGGHGHLARWKGLAIDNLICATLVLADGSEVECSAESAEHAELFWGLKGGGANFGVLVSCTLRAHKVGYDETSKGKGKVHGGMRILRNGKGFPFGNTLGHAECVKRWRDYCLNAPDEVSSNLILPAGAPVHVQEYTYKGDPTSAKVEAKQWKANGKGVVSLLKPRSYFTDIQQFVGKMEEAMAKKGGAPPRMLNVLACALPDEAVEVLCHATTKGAPKGVGEVTVILQALGGKIARPEAGEDASAFSQREVPFWIVVSGCYSKPGKQPTPSQLETLDAYLHDVAKKLQPLVLSPSAGAVSISAPYVAGVPTDYKHTLGGTLFTEAKEANLRALKSKYDPEGVFWAVENGMSLAPAISPSAI